MTGAFPPLTVWALALGSIALSASAQLLMKVGMSRASLNTPSGPLAGLLDAAISPHVIGGLSCYALSAVLWLAVLSRMPLSMAYPMVALGITLVVTLSGVLLGEPLPAARIAGAALIIAGVAMIGLRG